MSEMGSSRFSGLVSTDRQNSYLCIGYFLPRFNSLSTARQWPTSSTSIVTEEESLKSRTIALLLCFFLGSLGAHRFYPVKNTTAITMLILWIIGIATVWILIGIPFLMAVGIWSLIDLILIIVGDVKDGEGKLVTRWET